MHVRLLGRRCRQAPEIELTAPCSIIERIFGWPGTTSACTSHALERHFTSGARAELTSITAWLARYDKCVHKDNTTNLKENWNTRTYYKRDQVSRTEHTHTCTHLALCVYLSLSFALSLSLSPCLSVSRLSLCLSGCFSVSLCASPLSPSLPLSLLPPSLSLSLSLHRQIVHFRMLEGPGARALHTRETDRSAPRPYITRRAQR